MQLPDGIPRLAIIAVVILALIGAVWFWKRWKSGKTDKELTENDKAQRHAAVYADNVAKSLQDYEDDTDSEDDEEQTGAVTAEYTHEVQRGLDSEDSEDMEDDEEYEPMD